MNKELKKAIFIWLVENENVWQRVNACHEAFSPYIYAPSGEYLVFGGKETSEFIKKADELLYRG